MRKFEQSILRSKLCAICCHCRGEAEQLKQNDPMVQIESQDGVDAEVLADSPRLQASTLCHLQLEAIYNSHCRGGSQQLAVGHRYLKQGRVMRQQPT